MILHWHNIRFQIKSGKGEFEGKWWVYMLTAGPNGHRVKEEMVGTRWEDALAIVNNTIAYGKERSE